MIRTRWQHIEPKHSACSPNLLLLDAYLRDRWGGQSLGCYVRRPIRGGSSWSSHAHGAAIDWRYSTVGAGLVEVGRERLDTEVLPWLIAHHVPLGVQQIHDYRRGRIWRCDRGGDGWASASGSAFGETWAQWLHIETTDAAWDDDRPIAARVGSTPPAPRPVPPRPQPSEVPRMTTLTITLEVLRRGSSGADVRRVQALIAPIIGRAIKVDGQYGPITERAVRDAQRNLTITVDGWVGTQTWRALLDR